MSHDLTKFLKPKIKSRIPRKVLDKARYITFNARTILHLSSGQAFMSAGAHEVCQDKLPHFPFAYFVACAHVEQLGTVLYARGGAGPPP